MSTFFGGKSQTVRSSSYSVKKLVIHSEVTPLAGHADTHFICDLDKTYLETNIESLIAMARTAFEDAPEKQTVAGATETLKAARWCNPCGKPSALHFVSASPPQIRTVIEAKLKLDGLQWNSDTYKNQVYNLRKGRMDLLRNHVAYKSYAICNILRQVAPNSRVVFIGDNAEHDAYIYSGFKFYASGRLNQQQYIEYIRLSGDLDNLSEEISEALAELPSLAITGIHIRETPGYQTVTYPPLTSGIQYFRSYYEVLLQWYVNNVIADVDLWQLTRQFHNRYSLGRAELAAYLEAALKQSNVEEHRAEISTCVARLGLDSNEVTKPQQPGGLGQDPPLMGEELLAQATQWLLAQEKAKRERAKSES